MEGKKTMAESVVSSVVRRVGDLLIQETGYLYGVRDQVEQLRVELAQMQRFLEDANKRQGEDKLVQAWVSEIRNVAYEVEDAMDTFSFRIASRRRRGTRNAFKRFVCISNEAAELHEIGSYIEAITAKIIYLGEVLQNYGISEGEGSSSNETQQLRRWTYDHDVKEFAVGLDKDVETLVEQLVNEGSVTVSIFGMGGLGKTTLAQKVYHHSAIRRHFDCFAWASISQQCNRRHVWERILFELISVSEVQRVELIFLRDEELAMKLYEIQLKKKCLVILDDVWTTEVFDSLRPIFPIRLGNASKLLLTTRNGSLGQHVDPRAFVYEPRCLSEEEGWDLLQKAAFPGRDEPGFMVDNTLKTLGRKMVEMCGGLPLAIIVLGGLLATKHTLNEWDKVHGKLEQSFRAKGHEQHSIIIEVLALSYDELPYRLKPCFLHLSHFPEDYDIPTKKLVRMWVAEGIVSPMQYELEGEAVEDVAKRYLDELMRRFMVQMGVRGLTGRVKTCRLHNLMRDLCVSRARQENFLKIVHIDDGNESIVNIANSRSRVRRLAVYLDGENLKIFSLKCERMPYLQSLLFFCPYGTFQLMEFKFNNFILLKILDLGNGHCPKNLPREVGKLKQLRYLSLKFYSSTNLPASFGNLRYLQTLILDSNGCDIRIPNVILKMEQLRHLYLPRLEENRTKLQLGNLRDLQVLRCFDAMRFDVEELVNLTNLKKLEIIHLKSLEELGRIFVSSCATLSHLCSLKISIDSLQIGQTEADLGGLFSRCRFLYKLFLHGMIAKLPEYHYFPVYLINLTLEGSELEEDPMPTLEKLPCLTILRLDRIAFIGKRMVCSCGGFPHLKSLLLSGLPNLEEWYVDEEALPNLLELVIQRCRNLKMLPDGLRFLTTLQQLNIKGMPAEFANRLRVESKGGEDLSKVQHVPSIMFKRRQ